MTLAAVRRILELETQVRDLELEIAELRAQLRRAQAEASEQAQAGGE
jgi:hypothetical protein